MVEDVKRILEFTKEELRAYIAHVCVHTIVGGACYWTWREHAKTAKLAQALLDVWSALEDYGVDPAIDETLAHMVRNQCELASERDEWALHAKTRTGKILYNFLKSYADELQKDGWTSFARMVRKRADKEVDRKV